MDRVIVDFYQDSLQHWVALLDCGHSQHMRHNPPWEMREWVLTPAGRSARIGSGLDCVLCDEEAFVRNLLPPIPYDAEGRMRTIGIEFEYAGVGLDRSAEFIARALRGEVHKESTFVCHVRRTAVGEFKIEIDSALLKDKKYHAALESLGFAKGDIQSNSLERWLMSAFSTVVPYELITPPLSIEKLPLIDTLRAGLRGMGALGTKASILYGFGLHLNVGAPSLEVSVIQRYLQAFLLLYPAIRRAVSVDFTRSVLPFITPFSHEYTELILSPDYPRSGERFISDYLLYNPTRNRPLDLLPLLACIDKQAVDAAVGEAEYGKSRPAFHYRMPNCLIDDPDWSIQKEWNTWLMVERLTADDRALADAAGSYRAENRSSYLGTA